MGTGVLGVGTVDLYMEMFYNEQTTIYVGNWVGTGVLRVRAGVLGVGTGDLDMEMFYNEQTTV